MSDFSCAGKRIFGTGGERSRLLESLQGQKIELLTQIEQAWQGFDGPVMIKALTAVRTLMADCKDKHIRNDLLLRRQMEL